jgi:quercetin dioxygenase-like cupin family protein
MQRNAWELDTWQGAGRSMKILVSPGETGTKELTVLLVEFEPGKGTAVHTHDGIEVMFVVDGEGTSVEDGKESKISPNSVVMAPKGVPHQIVNGPEGKMHMITIYVPPLPDSFFQANYKRIPPK